MAEVENNDKAEEAYTQTQNILMANPDLKGLYVTAGGPSGAAKALVDMGLQDQVMLVCHDVLEAVSYTHLDVYMRQGRGINSSL